MKKPVVENIDDLSTDIVGTTGFLKIEHDVDPALVDAYWRLSLCLCIGGTGRRAHWPHKDSCQV